MAEELGYTEDATLFRSTMERVKEGYNKCWNGYAYRHPSYQESTDDRVQALAVISGIADETKYKRILNLFPIPRTVLYGWGRLPFLQSVFLFFPKHILPHP